MKSASLHTIAAIILLQIPFSFATPTKGFDRAAALRLGAGGGKRYMTHGSGRVGSLKSYRTSGPYAILSFGVDMSAVSSGPSSVKMGEGVQVRVAPPYDLHSCSQTTDDPNLLARIQKVVRSAAPGTGCSCCPLPCPSHTRAAFCWHESSRSTALVRTP